MRIENLRTETYHHRTRVVANVIWENRDRPEQELYFETTSEFAHELDCNPNAFLTACALPAMRYGETRITIDQPICPELKAGLITVMNWLAHWSKSDRKPIAIEAPLQTISTPSSQVSRAGCFFSGGIDSLALLRTNRLNFPPTHPRAIQDGILVYGILNGEDENDASFQNVIDAVAKMAQDAGINLIQISTNAYAHLRDLDSDFKFWKHEFQGSFLAAVAHTLSRRLNTVSIASTYDLANLAPWGSHPCLDHHFSSNDLKIRHENETLSRLEKTKIVAQWDVAIQNLRVCNEKNSYSQGNYNCGKCEKCVRTMTALLALGLLERTPTFLEKNVTEDLLVKHAYVTDSYEEACYRELMTPLVEMRRYDLVNGIKRIINRYHEQDFKGMIKRLDRSVFRGNLLNFGKTLGGLF
ncbi:hypothetical protein STA3757_39330 [Stanieria sp. NIES-3757]|nr:hypothetical protein STA3757_39330 [Stanieria sp. NIES-3757]